MSKTPTKTTTVATTTKVELDQPIATQKTVETLFAQYQTAFKRVAAEGLDLSRLMQVAIMTMSRSPELLGCTAVSLLGAFMQAAQMGLDLGMREAYLVPYKNKFNKGTPEVQLIPDYRGLIKLARQSGQIKDLWARLVYKGERWKVVEGDNPRLDHTPDYNVDRSPKNIIAAYTIATWEDNRLTFEVVTREKIERAKKASASETGPWSTDYDEMALKTAIKHRCKTLPRSHRMISALELDERAELGKPQNIELVGDGERLMAQVGPEITAGPEPGGDVVLISPTQQGKMLAWFKQHKWTESDARRMLASTIPSLLIDASAPTLAEVVAQVPDKVFETFIETIEKGPPKRPSDEGPEPERATASAPEGPSPAAAPAPEKPTKTQAPPQPTPESEISEDQYNDLWSMAVDADCTGEAQRYAKSLGYAKLRNVMIMDLEKVARLIQTHKK